MKKNLISVIILALILANLILTVILTISIMPQTKKANELISKVAAAIELDLASGASDEDEAAVVSMADTDTYAIEEDVSVTLKKGDDGKQHWAIVKVSLNMNTKDKGYKEFGSAEKMKTNEENIKSLVLTTMGGYTMDDLTDPSKVEEGKKIILEKIRKLYDSDFIYEVVFSKMGFQ